LPSSLVRQLGVVPSYYLRYFYAHDEVVREMSSRPSRAADVAAIEQRLLELYADPTLDTKPPELEQRGGAFYSEAAVALVSRLLSAGAPDVDLVQVVNIENQGTLPFLPADHVIEVSARIGPAGAEALQVAPIEPLYAGLIGHVAAYERLALEAALKGGRERVFEALLAHPLVGQAVLARGLTDRLIDHNRDYLRWA
jgi:6-phospho-beta-glucosidase